MSDETRNDQHEQCRSCGAALSETSRFCSECGKRVTRIRHGKRLVLATVCCALGAWATAWAMQAKLAGEKPETQFAGHTTPPPAGELPPDIRELRERADASPTDPEAWRALATRLQAAMATAAPEGAERLVFELVDTLAHLIEINPDDVQAISALADLAFQRQAFSKAAELYERLLESVPGNPDIAARLASTYTFLGRTDDAVRILDALLNQNPDHFQARAYLSIAYAQRGETEAALREGQKALELAPHDAARDRFEAFLSKLDADATGEAVAEPEDHGPISALEQHLRQNSVTASKFVRAKLEGNEVHIFFRDFPMQGMPVFAKLKFLSGIRKSLGDLGSSDIVFLDADSGDILERSVFE